MKQIIIAEENTSHFKPGLFSFPFIAVFGPKGLP